MPLQIKMVDGAAWAIQAAEIIQGAINVALREQGECSVMLTGGRSAVRLYSAWAANPALQQLTGVQFYFGDERCVPPDHPDSNYGTVMRSLFAAGVPHGCLVFRMEADDSDREFAARRYGELLPEKIDVMLFGVGDDGHIASMFPRSESVRETQRKVILVTGPNPPLERLTITPPVIVQAKSTFVLAAGADKVKVLTKALQVPDDVDALPVRLVLNATWLLDTPFPGENH